MYSKVIQLCVCIHTHTHMYIYTHTHAHICIYTFSDSKLKLLMSLPSLSSMPSWKPQAALIFSLSPRWTLELEGYFLSIFFCFHYAHDLVHQLVNWSPCFSPLLYSTPEIWGSVEGGLSTPQPGLERLWVFVLFKNFFSYFWLLCISAATCGFSLVVAGRGSSPVVMHGLLIMVAPLAADHRLSCPKASGIFLDQGSNPCPLHWQVGLVTTEPSGKYLALWFYSLLLPASRPGPWTLLAEHAFFFLSVCSGFALNFPSPFLPVESHLPFKVQLQCGCNH